MQLNPDLIFSRKTLKPAQSVIYFNNSLVVHANIQKNRGLFSDEKLNSSRNIKITSPKLERNQLYQKPEQCPS